MMPNLGDLQEGDIVPCLRPPYSEGTAFVSDIQKYVRPYKVFTALLSHTGNDAPVLINLLENTLGAEVSFNFINDGLYSATVDSNIFTTGKTFVMVNMWGDDSGSPMGGSAWPKDQTEVYFANTNGYNENFYISLEIRVYYSEPA